MGDAIHTNKEIIESDIRELPNQNELKGIALVVSWNLWQMDIIHK